jgi:hypothetical protein
VLEDSNSLSHDPVEFKCSDGLIRIAIVGYAQRAR